MASSLHEIIARVTSNRRSRLGYFEIQDAKVVGNTLWLLLIKPDGSPVVAWERFTQTNGVWNATLFSADMPDFVATPGQLFADAVNSRPQVSNWQRYVENVQARRDKLRNFRRTLAPRSMLTVNGYAYTLVRRLISGPGWVVQRDGTEMRLEGKNFETAVKLACPA